MNLRCLQRQRALDGSPQQSQDNDWLQTIQGHLAIVVVAEVHRCLRHDGTWKLYVGVQVSSLFVVDRIKTNQLAMESTFIFLVAASYLAAAERRTVSIPRTKDQSSHLLIGSEEPSGLMSDVKS